MLEIVARRSNHLQLLPPPLVVIIVPYKATIESHVKRYETWGPCASSDEIAETVRAKMSSCFFLCCTRRRSSEMRSSKHSFKIRLIGLDALISMEPMSGLWTGGPTFSRVPKFRQTCYQMHARLRARQRAQQRTSSGCCNVCTCHRNRKNTGFLPTVQTVF